LMVFNATFNNISVYIMAVSFIGGENFITWCCTPRPDKDSNSHLGSVVELVIKLIIWLAIITWFIANHILS
jgi:hypothetical protein